mmetsp:Transcript_30110/g.70213  ORF Transcript_30110/g.70213 Transcript_30110/m.70213 type:complete len:773 (+) Transcript_30110:167-2485(+)|eukprot:CAMPEP_0178385316 /NCGR_PEP_ID=MMETSP0689_2-20121128/7971_1 /TAXON_ID=160604 /ORGANISM="Amphidinium massartii, Strain CS-259" /LENGTH=772 /DNA_ID=CAMNT_0020005597 /DNA_START=79 /DNA_END=2397 /DNA_ORIENTATION=-
MWEDHPLLASPSPGVGNQPLQNLQEAPRTPPPALRRVASANALPPSAFASPVPPSWAPFSGSVSPPLQRSQDASSIRHRRRSEPPRCSRHSAAVTSTSQAAKEWLSDREQEQEIERFLADIAVMSDNCKSSSAHCGNREHCSADARQPQRARSAETSPAKPSWQPVKEGEWQAFSSADIDHWHTLLSDFPARPVPSAEAAARVAEAATRVAGQNPSLASFISEQHRGAEAPSLISESAPSTPIRQHRRVLPSSPDLGSKLQAHTHTKSPSTPQGGVFRGSERSYSAERQWCEQQHISETPSTADTITPMKSRQFDMEDAEATVQHELAPCPLCHRKFRADRLAIHVQVCNRGRNIKTRGVFNSKEQRCSEISGWWDSCSPGSVGLDRSDEKPLNTKTLSQDVPPLPAQTRKDAGSASRAVATAGSGAGAGKKDVKVKAPAAAATTPNKAVGGEEKAAKCRSSSTPCVAASRRCESKSGSARKPLAREAAAASSSARKQRSSSSSTAAIGVNCKAEPTPEQRGRQRESETGEKRSPPARQTAAKLNPFQTPTKPFKAEPQLEQSLDPSKESARRRTSSSFNTPSASMLLQSSLSRKINQSPLHVAALEDSDREIHSSRPHDKTTPKGETVSPALMSSSSSHCKPGNGQQAAAAATVQASTAQARELIRRDAASDDDCQSGAPDELETSPTREYDPSRYASGHQDKIHKNLQRKLFQSSEEDQMEISEQPQVSEDTVSCRDLRAAMDSLERESLWVQEQIRECAEQIRMRRRWA